MTLHEAIELVLRRKRVPMAPWEIERELALSEEYLKKDLTKAKAEQIISRVRKYPHLFQIVNGYIINVKDEDLIILVKSVNRIKLLLGDIFSLENVQLIIASLLFYKRLVDVKIIEDSNLLNRYSIFRKFEFMRFSELNVFYDLESQLNRIGVSALDDLFTSLKSIETIQYGDERFASIFEFIIYNLSAEKSRFKNSSPEFVRYLLPKLVDKKSVNSILDPTAGMGGILTSALKSYPSAEIFGTEINMQSAAIGNLNLYLHGRKEEPILTKSFFQAELKSFDIIVADFPISGVSYKNISEIDYYYQNFSSKERGFAPLVTRSYQLLSNRGKAIITIGDSFLTRRGFDENVRRDLVLNDAIETIISLPPGSYRPYSNAKMSILILNKNKSNHLRKKIRFIRVSSIENSRAGVVLDVSKIIEEYHFFGENTKFQNILDIDDLDEDYNLTAERNSPQNLIRKTMLKEGAAIFLESLADIQRGLAKSNLSEFPNNLPIIKIEDLDEEVLDIKLKVKNEFEFSLVNDFELSKYVISKPCILIATIGKKTKTNIFYPTPQTPYIIISGSIAAITLKNDYWDLEYIYFQINSSFVRDQINSFKKGNVIPYFNLINLKKVLIPYAELALQKAKIEQQKSEIIFRDDLYGKSNLSREEVAKQTEQNELDLVRTITHQLKHMLMTVYTQVEKVKRISDANELGTKKEYNENSTILDKIEGFEAPENLSLDEVIANTRSSTDLLNKILDDVKKAIHLDLELNTHSIKGIIEEVANTHPTLNIKIKGIDLELKLSRSHIIDVFQTLISNSIQHSFNGTEEGDVEFHLRSSQDNLIIEYVTNGASIKISEREYKSIATKSTNSNGTGMGGYYIHKVIQAHNGKLRIREKLKYGVKIEIELPLLNDYE